MKHAYLIMAHTEPEMLKRLIAALDDERNDIFIHFDKKWKDAPVLTTTKAKLYQHPDRQDVKWGEVSLIHAEFQLFEMAHNTNRYARYHLLSGVDFPLKSQDYIHDFCHRHADREFVGLVQQPEATYRDRVCRYFFFVYAQRESNTLKRRILKMVRMIAERVVNAIVKRPKEYNEVKKGANWVSITDEMCSYLLSRKAYVLRRFRMCNCSDEFFIQTELWNSPFRDRLYCQTNEYRGCLRKIDWRRGDPYVWKESDIDELMASEALFARKITSVKLADEIKRRYSL